ncbi:ISC system 2Fe-2S type ferredoxin [Turicimonas muris]|mgnify:CR=1 FL=1|uniref:ISC system 2Fe-2S type ferredoxin n=1 Tax=Turicimonas muris TaxID=1796652 RepID=UPI0023F29542|nr:ISC system 2Fe-2S type ferredoxin [Turicimonas muris]MBS4768540.1 ISC system 2Fe-2S type ferredoxin [Burkholderiales bacterium]
MPKITVLPHETICPNGKEFEVPAGTNLARALLDNGVPIEHACELSCACTTCHCYIDKGFDTLAPAEDDEEDLLDQAWGLKSNSRLSCQTTVGDEDITVEIPKYSRNHAREAF